MTELRQATRTLLRSPGFTAVAVLTLGLGMGASASIFGLLDRVVLAPLPYPEADRLVSLTSETAEGTWNLSRAQYALFRDEARTLDRLAGFTLGQATVLSPDGPERTGVWRGTASFFQLLGARPEVGRLIDEQDDEFQATLVAVLSYAYWQRAFGGDPSVIGRTLSVNEIPVEIVGVMEPILELPLHVTADVRPDVWLPLQLNLGGQFWNSHMEFRTIARLAPGRTAEDADRELAAFNPVLIELFPDAYNRSFMERYAFRTRAEPLRGAMVGEVATNLWILLAGIGLVLVIACANIANLFLVRAEGRRRDMAVRTALGAGRWALLRHSMAESLVVSGAGAVVAVVFATWCTAWLTARAPGSIPRLEGAVIGANAIAFTVLLMLVVAAALSVLPTIRSGGLAKGSVDLGDGGRGTTVGRERNRARGMLVATQVALALVLLVGAGLLFESYRRLHAVDPGFQPAGVLAVSVSLPGARYDTFEKRWHFYDALLTRVRALPGVTGAGASQALPFADGFGCTVQAFSDAEVLRRIQESNNTLCAAQVSTTDGYFETLGIPRISGRGLTRADSHQPAAGSVVVSRAFAEKFWPGEDPLGKEVAPAGRSQGPFYRVVGVVGDVYGLSAAEPPAVVVYYPVVPIPSSGGFWGNDIQLVVKSAAGDPMALFPQIRASALELDPAVPLANPRTMESLVAASMASLSFMLLLLGAAALAALLLAAIGLYGVLSYLVQRRTGEIGVRVALGARPRQVERMIVGGSMRIAGAGLLLGIAAAVALTRFLGSLLYGIEPTHPAAYAGAVVSLAAVAALASWVPARRAARVDPVEALRTE